MHRREVRSLLAVGALSLVLMAGSAEAGHKFAHGMPRAAGVKKFAADFITPKDSEWGFDIGGFGGISKRGTLKYNPVIFVHGNVYDADFWDAAEVPPTTMNVRKAFRDAGYTDQEIWGLSYNGKGCFVTADCGSANDVNIPDLYNFIQAVRAYTGAAKVDVVGHSLGVTIVRKTVFAHPELLDQIEDMVLIAGANHGTSSCRGVETTWYGCDEVAPGSAWLAELDGWNPKQEGDETPGPIRYMTIYDGSGAADTFYLKTPPLYDDSQSPRLSGADNRTLPGTLHLPLARGKEAIAIYLPFLQNHNDLTLSGSLRHLPDSGVGSNRGLAATGSSSWLSLFGVTLLISGLGLRRFIAR